MKEQKPSDNARRKGEEEEEESMRVWDCGSPLYDSYELVSLSHVIDRHMMILPSPSLMSGSSRRASSPPGPAVAEAATTTTARELISVASNKIKKSRVILSSSSIIIGSKIKMITRSSSSSVFSAFLNKLAWKTGTTPTSRGRERSKPCCITENRGSLISSQIN